MSGAAREMDESVQLELRATGTDGSAAGLRQVATERLAEHRQRRAAAQTQAVEAAGAEAQGGARNGSRSGSSRVKDAVAARYQNSVSYREFLAMEAERALAQAQAEVEVATRNARAVADAQMQLLEELQQFTQPAPGPREVAMAEHAAKSRDELAHAMADIAVAATQAMHLQPRIEFEAEKPKYTVRLYEELGAGRSAGPGYRAPMGSRGEHMASAEHKAFAEHKASAEHEASALDEEIAFRLAPEFENRTPEPVGVSGNVIEFPRQLVAARKARPRLAEGPLREESVPEPQLRIFEVEPEQISEAPAEAASAPEWQGILLESASRKQAAAELEAPQVQFALQPQTARLELRVMAFAVDACCVAGALVAFAAVAAKLAGPRLMEIPLPMLGAVAGVALGVLFVAYQMLFFTLSEATPGMCYARIGLCTFGDRNPSRAAMRRRVLATVLAASPFGLGIFWAWMDEDRLGWHDRMSQMYQRGY